MENLKIDNWTVKVTANHSKKTFTIRFIDPFCKVCLSKFRTIPVSKSDFEYQYFWYTPGDWRKYIRNSNSNNWINIL